MSDHTPGPWRWTEAGGTEIVTDAQVDLAGEPITVAQAIEHMVAGHPSLEWYEIEANARLIAAAPELLAFVRTIATVTYNLDGNLWRQAAALVAKATGAQP